MCFIDAKNIAPANIYIQNERNLKIKAAAITSAYVILNKELKKIIIAISEDPIPPGKKLNTPEREAIGIIIIVAKIGKVIPMELNAKNKITPSEIQMNTDIGKINKNVFLSLKIMKDFRKLFINISMFLLLDLKIFMKEKIDFNLFNIILKILSDFTIKNPEIIKTERNIITAKNHRYIDGIYEKIK